MVKAARSTISVGAVQPVPPETGPQIGAQLRALYEDLKNDPSAVRRFGEMLARLDRGRTPKWP